MGTEKYDYDYSPQEPFNFCKTFFSLTKIHKNKVIWLVSHTQQYKASLGRFLFIWKIPKGR